MVAFHAIPAQGADDRHAEGLALQRWAASYDPSDGLFESLVGIDSYGTTFTFIATGAWESLSNDEQHAVMTNAVNAVKTVWCLQSDHRGELIPGLTVEIVDDEADILDGQVTGPGLVCR